MIRLGCWVYSEHNYIRITWVWAYMEKILGLYFLPQVLALEPARIEQLLEVHTKARLPATQFLGFEP